MGLKPDLVRSMSPKSDAKAALAGSACGALRGLAGAAMAREAFIAEVEEALLSPGERAAGGDRAEALVIAAFDNRGMSPDDGALFIAALAAAAKGFGCALGLEAMERLRRCM